MATSDNKFIVLGILFILSGFVSIGYGLFVSPLLLALGLLPIGIGIYFCQPEHNEHGENGELIDQFWVCPKCYRKNRIAAKRCSKCGFFRSEEIQKGPNQL